MIGQYLFDSGLRDYHGRPIYRISVELPDGMPPQGNHGVRRGRIYDANEDRIKAVRHSIAQAANYQKVKPTAPITGDVFVEWTVYIPRPDKHYLAGGFLRDNAPTYCGIRGKGRGDADKMERTIFDAISAGAAGGAAWIADDCQVVDHRGRKLFIDRHRPARVDIALLAI